MRFAKTLRLWLSISCLASATASAASEPEREVIVCVLAWFSPVGGFHGTFRWAPGAYRYESSASDGVRNYPLPAPIDWPDSPPEVGRAGYWRMMKAAIRHDLQTMKGAGFDVATFDMLPSTSYDRSRPLSVENAPLVHFPTFLAWLEAAKETGMKVGVMPDVKTMEGKVPTVAQWTSILEDTLRNVPASPALWKIGGRPVLIHFGSDSFYSSYAPDKEQPKPLGGWDLILRDLRRRNPKFYFIADIRPHQQVLQWDRVADAVHLFAPASPSEFLVDVQRKLDNRFRVPLVWIVSPGYYRGASAYTEPDFQRIHDTYEAAMKAGAKRMYVLTWNDFNEDTDIAPSKNKGRALLDVFAFYNQWFKTGREPRPRQDKVVISYPIRIPETVITQPPAFGLINDDLTSAGRKSAAPAYAPTMKYWAYVANPPLELDVPGVGKVVFYRAGVSAGELGTVGDGALVAKLGERSIELPAVSRTAKEEFRKGQGGLEHRYIDLTAQP